MKRTVFLLSLLLGISPSLRAQEIDGVSVGNLKMDRNGEYLSVKMDIGLSKLDVESNRDVLLTPRLVNGPVRSTSPHRRLRPAALLLLRTQRHEHAFGQRRDEL